MVSQICNGQQIVHWRSSAARINKHVGPWRKWWGWDECERGGRIVAASEMLRPSLGHVQQAEVGIGSSTVCRHMDANLC
jgi:hypothetical protein